MNLNPFKKSEPAPAAVAPAPDAPAPEPTAATPVIPVEPITLAAPEPIAATIAELRSAFSDNPAFALEAAENKWSLLQAKAEAFDRLVKANAAQAALDAKLGGIGKGGAAPVKTAPKASAVTNPNGTDKHPYLQAIDQAMADGLAKNLAEATNYVNKNHADLRAEYVGRAR